MGRLGARLARVQVSSRLTWTFSARIGPDPARSRPVAARPAGVVRCSGRLARAVLRAVRPRLPLPHRSRGDRAVSRW
ncbi:hypothetical protein [Streptomyces sp. NPDC046860]|uniref:hypothetical protein n=1 Tax=Streptomyces sp. NPDC046860 TaxID=3154495 RepID=UPI0033FE7031